MPNEETANINYQKGFNEGYLITKHLPDLSDSLAQIKNETPRVEGFQDGRKQFVLEQTREHRPSWMKADRRIEPQENRSPDRDKDPDLNV